MPDGQSQNKAKFTSCHGNLTPYLCHHSMGRCSGVFDTAGTMLGGHQKVLEPTSFLCWPERGGHSPRVPHLGENKCSPVFAQVILH